MVLIQECDVDILKMYLHNDDDDDDDEIAYFTVCWKTRQLVLSTAPKTWDNTDKDSKNRKRSH